MLCNKISEIPRKGFFYNCWMGGWTKFKKKRIYFRTLHHSSYSLLPSVVEFFTEKAVFLGHPIGYWHVENYFLTLVFILKNCSQNKLCLLLFNSLLITKCIICAINVDVDVDVDVGFTNQKSVVNQNQTPPPHFQSMLCTTRPGNYGRVILVPCKKWVIMLMYSCTEQVTLYVLERMV